MVACSSNIALSASEKSSKGTLLGAPELPTDICVKGADIPVNSEINDHEGTSGTIPPASEKVESSPSADEVNADVAPAEVEGVTEEVKTQVEDQQGAAETGETITAVELETDADTRFDFGPGFLTKCSSCGKFTKNRGDKDTRQIFCDACYGSYRGSLDEVQPEMADRQGTEETAPCLPEGSDVKIEEAAPEADETQPAEKPALEVDANAADELKSAEEVKVEDAPAAEEPKPAEQPPRASWTQRLQKSVGLTRERKSQEEANPTEEVGSAETAENPAHEAASDETQPAETPALGVEANAADELKSAEEVKVEDAPAAEEPKPEEQPPRASWTQRLLSCSANPTEDVGSAEKPSADMARASEEPKTEGNTRTEETTLEDLKPAENPCSDSCRSSSKQRQEETNAAEDSKLAVDAQ